jgi:amino acid efflux transporter
VIALPALAAATAGPASLIAWLGLVVLSAPLAATFAALGARHPDSGGVSTYARLAFGPRAAAVVGWCFYFAVPVGAPAAAMFAGQYVSTALGGGQRTVLVTVAVLMLIVSVSNWFGLKVSGRLQLGLAGLLVALLVTAVAVSLPHARPANLHPFAPHGWLAIAPAAALLVWSFAGWEAITHLAADFRRPRRTCPAPPGSRWSSSACSTWPWRGRVCSCSARPPRPARRPWPICSPWASAGDVHLLAAAAAILLTLGAMNAYYAGAAKLGAALGRDGALPGWLARGSSAGEVPRRSLAVVSTLGAGACSSPRWPASAHARSSCSPPAASSLSTASAPRRRCACCRAAASRTAARWSRSLRSRLCSSPPGGTCSGRWPSSAASLLYLRLRGRR